MKFRLLSLFPLAFCITILPLSSRGGDLTWQNTGTGDWTAGGNWSGGAAPTVSDNALIDNGGTALLGSGATGTTDDLTLGSSGTGILDIDAGSLSVTGGIISGANATGSGSILISDGGVLATSGIAVGAGTGALSIDSGTLQALSNNSNFLTGYQAGQVTIGTGGVTVDTNGNAIAINAGLGGAGGLTKVGAGDLTLSGSSSYSGGIVVQQGTLRIGDSDAIGSGTLTINGGGIGNSGSDSADFILNNVQANSDFAIDVTGTGGTVEVFGNVDLGSAATRTITLTSSGLACFGGTISGQGLTLLATGTFTQAMFCSNSTNTFTGTLTIGAGVQLELQKDSDAIAVPGDLDIQAGGSVILEVTNQLAVTSNVEVDGILSEAGSETTTFNSLSGTGAIIGGSVDSNIIAVNSGSFAGSISEENPGGQALIMQGTGVLVLSGSNSYTGGTSITSGTLRAENDHALGGGSVSVTNTGVLSVAANHSLNTGGNVVSLQANGRAAYAKDFASQESFGDANTIASGGSSPATAQILSGTASTAETVTMTASSTSAAQNDSSRLSDVVSLQGTGTDVFTFQLSLSGTNSGAELGWLDGTANWANAVTGNTGNNATAGMLDYQGSFANFQITYGSTLSGYIGAWGIDTSGGSTAAWAVVNHDGDFAVVTPVPEPSAGILVILGLGVALSMAGPRLVRRARFLH